MLPRRSNNKLVVAPEWRMVVVRMGDDGHPGDPDRVYGRLLEQLGAAILD